MCSLCSRIKNLFQNANRTFLNQCEKSCECDVTFFYIFLSQIQIQDGLKISVWYLVIPVLLGHGEFKVTEFMLISHRLIKLIQFIQITSSIALDK